MNTSNTDVIHKEITLQAAPARVWRAISDAAEFGAWFGVRLEGQFRVGETIQGQITHPGYEHLTFKAQVERMDSEQCFALRWKPTAVDPERDCSKDPTTLVEFRLQAAGGGTRLTVTESGFDAIPAELRKEAFLRNEGGWTQQTQNIKKHCDG